MWTEATRAWGYPNFHYVASSSTNHSPRYPYAIMGRLSHYIRGGRKRCYGRWRGWGRGDYCCPTRPSPDTALGCCLHPVLISCPGKQVTDGDGRARCGIAGVAEATRAWWYPNFHHVASSVGNRAPRYRHASSSGGSRDVCGGWERRQHYGWRRRGYGRGDGGCDGGVGVVGAVTGLVAE